MRNGNSNLFHALAIAALAILILLGGGHADAHIVLSEPTAQPGARYTAHFKVGHGCSGEATTGLSIALPEGITAVAGEDKPGWTLQTRRDGGRVRAVIWSGGSAAPDKPEIFTVTMTLPAREGALAFPATQTCGATVETWSEVPTVGENSKRPAPVLTVSAVKSDVAVTVSGGWFRALPATVPSGAYFTLRNNGTKPVSLTGADSPACGMLMLHKSENHGGMGGMTMMETVDVAPGSTVSFAPGGYHLMCMDSKPILKPGSKVPVTLQFAGGASLTAQFDVRTAIGR